MSEIAVLKRRIKYLEKKLGKYLDRCHLCNKDITGFPHETHHLTNGSVHHFCYKHETMWEDKDAE